jgi:hypothetical protein
MILPIIKDEYLELGLLNPEKYKEFYLTKYAFDVAHLNAKGADLFTNYLAMEFKKRYFYIAFICNKHNK